VVLILLADIRDLRGDNQRTPAELVTRIRAVSAVLRRIRAANP
jgi:hypothetical protein